MSRTPYARSPQLDTNLDPTLAELVRRLVEAYQPLRVYLFGSRAEGRPGPDSDYDIMVVVPDNAPAERRGSRLGYQALRGTGVAADVLVWTEEEFDARLHLKASLPSAVVSQGRLLHAALSHPHALPHPATILTAPPARRFANAMTPGRPRGGCFR